MIAFIDGDVSCHSSSWGAETLEDAILKLDEIIEATYEDVFATDYIIALGGKVNFRETFYSEYKKTPSRVKARSTKPIWFNKLKDYLASKENTVVAEGFEADDLLRIWSNEAQKNNIDFIVCSIDKDLDCIPGKHFKPGKNIFYTVSEEEADRHYWMQILMGDPVDNIPGIPKIGKKKADNILSSCNNNNERKAAVIEAYKEHYGEEWKSYLLCNGRLIHIWRYIDDYFKIPKV